MSMMDVSQTEDEMKQSNPTKASAAALKKAPAASVRKVAASPAKKTAPKTATTPAVSQAKATKPVAAKPA